MAKDNAKLKTQKNEVNPEDFIETVADETKKTDAKAILKMMTEITKDKPKMWGSSIIGFIDTHLKYESGRELDWFKIGFSPRKQNLTIYGLDLVKQEKLLQKLGKHSTSKGCLYINKLSDVDLDVLRELIKDKIQE